MFFPVFLTLDTVRVVGDGECRVDPAVGVHDIVGDLLHDAVDGVADVLPVDGNKKTAVEQDDIHDNRLRHHHCLPRGDEEGADDEDDEGGLVVEAEDIVVNAHRVELDQPLHRAKDVIHGDGGVGVSIGGEGKGPHLTLLLDPTSRLRQSLISYESFEPNVVVLMLEQQRSGAHTLQGPFRKKSLSYTGSFSYHRLRPTSNPTSLLLRLPVLLLLLPLLFQGARREMISLMASTTNGRRMAT